MQSPARVRLLASEHEDIIQPMMRQRRVAILFRREREEIAPKYESAYR